MEKSEKVIADKAQHEQQLSGLEEAAFAYTTGAKGASENSLEASHMKESQQVGSEGWRALLEAELQKGETYCMHVICLY